MTSTYPLHTHAWDALSEFHGQIDASDQVLLVAGTGGAKSTLVATLTLGVGSLVAVDEKGTLTLPRSRIIDLPRFETAEDYYPMIARYLRWQSGHDAINRVILRPHVLDIEHFDAHDAIFRAVYDRGHTVLWLDEISATGANANRSQPWLRALSARGRTRGIGMWTLTQSPFGLVPPILRRNATYMILGPTDPQDVADLRRPGVEIATTLPRKQGKFIVYEAGTPAPFRLYVPIPPALRGWKAP